MTGATSALRLSGVRKAFGRSVALAGADLDVGTGEVHGLLGQNGCGKSTLVKILTGFYAPDEVHEAELWGQPLHLPIRRPSDHGVAVIHQALALAPAMSAVENIGVSVGYDRRPLSRVSWRRERRRTLGLLEQIGMAIDPDCPVDALSPAEQAGVAIARAIRELSERHERQLLVLDEPTAYLPGEEAGRVIRLMRSVADQGSSVIFISHRLGEVMEVCDRMTVLRDGRRVGAVAASETSPRQLIQMMLGRELASFYPEKLRPHDGHQLLQARGLTGATARHVNLDLRAGEIVGLTGLVGMGQQEIPYLISGAIKPASGTVTVAGANVTAASPRQMIERGISLIPAHRTRDGVWLDATAGENISLPRLSEYLQRGWLRRSAERDAAEALMTELGVRPPDPGRRMLGFSGGNQQKVVLAKWFQMKPRVLLVDEPTQGVDAGGKAEVLALLRYAADEGAGILYASSDFEEIAAVCHRVLIFTDGRVVAELSGVAVSEKAILEACHASGQATADALGA